MPTADWESTRRELIETYRILNTEYRGRDEEALAAERGGTSVKAIIRKMRDDELRFVKALNEQLTGVVMGASSDENDTPVIGSAVENESARELISQFGSARATTLNTMVSADEEAWNRTLIDNKTMLDLARERLESDRQYLERIRATA